MLQKIISVGDKVEIASYHNNVEQDDENRFYLSKVMDFKDTDKVCLTLPLKNNRVYVLDINEVYNVYFYAQLGMYRCKMRVVDRYHQNSLRLAVLRMESSLEKIQRRQFYRLSCINDIEFCLMKQENNAPDSMNRVIDKEIFEQGIMIDLSAGGCKFSSNHLLEPGNNIWVRFYLSLAKGMTRFLLIGKIITVNKLENTSVGYEYRVKFLQVEDEVRESIVRYIFEEERNRRKREKGLN